MSNKYIPQNLYNINGIHFWWTFSSRNTYLFIFTHFWWKHSSQTEEHACHKHTFIFFKITFVKVPMAFAKHIHIVMYDFHLFERFVIFGNGLQLFYGKFAFFQVSSHHIRVIGCTFFFLFKNTICCECDWKYSTVNVDGLMLYMHIFYSKSGRRTLCFLTYGFTCFPWVSLFITI